MLSFFYFKALVSLFETSAGGRVTGIRSGYRANLIFGAEHDNTDGCFLLEDQQYASPGVQLNAIVGLRHYHHIESFLYENNVFSIREIKVIGEGLIGEIIGFDSDIDTKINRMISMG